MIITHVSAGLLSVCEACCEDYNCSPEDIEKNEVFDEGCFSHSLCEADDCEGEQLPGTRYVAHGIDTNGEIVHFSICEDCLVQV